MDFFRVKDWDELQHYKDRAPPWIKLYNHLLDDYEFACLQDASKLHLLLIWLLASRNSNHLPFNEKWIKQRIGVESKVDLKELLEAGFIELEPSNNAAHQLTEQVASKPLADGKHDATTEERERERESRAEGEGEGEQKNILSNEVSPVSEIFSYWCQVMNKGSLAKCTKKREAKVKARLKDGYTIEQIKQAIDGCSRSSHHMGKNPASNPDGTIYDDLELICRNGEKLEFFARNISVGKVQQTNAVDDWINESNQDNSQGQVFEHDQY